jgi:proliferating cell nuclear antigen
MFNAVLADPKLLKSSIDAISNMIDEAGVNVSEAGLRLRAMDPAHVALVDFELGKEAFDKFEVSETLVLGLDLDRLNTILKRAGGGDRISLALDEEANSLRIKFENTSTRTFNLPLIEVSEEELKVPNLNFPCVVELSPSIISEAIKDAEIISDHVTLRVDKEYLYVTAKGDLGNVEVKVAKEEAVQFEAQQEAKSMFSIEYLKDMVKASDVASSVRLSLGDNIPVKMDFLAPNVRLSFLLAPRIESD